MKIQVLTYKGRNFTFKNVEKYRITADSATGEYRGFKFESVKGKPFKKQVPYVDPNNIKAIVVIY